MSEKTNPTIEENGIAIGEIVGLKTQTQLDGTKIFTDINGKIPNSQDWISTYWPEVFKRVVTQEIGAMFKNIASAVKVINKEKWANGVKDYFILGKGKLEDYEKTIKIDHFNPEDPYMFEETFSIDVKKVARIKLTISQIIEAFTNPAKLAEFVMTLISTQKKRFLIFYQNESLKLLSNTSSFVSYEYDRARNIGDLVADPLIIGENKFEKALYDLRTVLYDYGTASNDYLKFSRDAIPTKEDEEGRIQHSSEVYYQANPNDLEIVMSSKFQAGMDLEIAAKLFGPEGILPGVKTHVVNYGSIGLDDETSPAIMLVDKRTLKAGFQVDEFAWVYKGTNAQMIHELHYWSGWARVLDKAICVWYDATTA